METAVPFSTRNHERIFRTLPITLLLDYRDKETEYPASTINMSEHGLKIQTRAALDRGQTLEVLTENTGSRLAHCRVVWVHQQDSEPAFEAGLEILN
ncbi:MAG TPA: PilZ domain-containing protein [Terriglobia bacterium]|nr:PilZ domain-containing protein [Terriglobia bacterium]